MVSTCNSDDNSTGPSSTSHRSGAASSSSQCHVSPLASGSTTRPFDHAPSSGYWQHEEVDISILRPDSDSDGRTELPSLRDVTIKTSIPEERVLASFKSPISYTIPYSIQHDANRSADAGLCKYAKLRLNSWLPISLAIVDKPICQLLELDAGIGHDLSLLLLR